MSGLKNLDLNLLVVFEAVYSAGNISQAARRLGMSQPTISNALRRLRDGLDDPLFVRAGRGVHPTPRAIQMIGPVREALQMIESGVAPDVHFDPATSTRHFRVVVLDAMEPIVMPHVIRQIQAYRSVTIENLAVVDTPMSDRLNDGSLDLVIANFLAESRDTHCEALAPVHLSVVARNDHPAISGEFSLDHFQTLGHVALVPRVQALSRMLEVLRRLDIQRHVAYSVTKFWSFPHILMTTDLVAILPTAFAKVISRNHPLALYDLPFAYPEEQIYMTWKTSRTNDPGHRWLREEIASAVRQAAAQAPEPAQ
ncbi:LysR family transcriptional regulator [uncultured Nitratireductor sp.]|uniref:LysR family transcriptional regulator n=1 Tax=uncultured Nitratireductor sp. TaxID=520953 RepID=UPI0025E4FA64|nr:LysR family transcriptional regulator [uncultured Nitratireductor sp.]